MSTPLSTVSRSALAGLAVLTALLLTSCDSEGPILNEPPTARFSYAPESPETGEAVTFTAEAEDADGQVTGYSWDFDGDGEEDASGMEAEYAFDEAGDYEVVLTVTDDGDSSANASQTVSVALPPLQNVVVGNGGNFGQDNGSLTFYDASANTATTTGSIGGFVTGLSVRGDALYTLLNSGTSSGGVNITSLDMLADGSTAETSPTTSSGRRIGALRDIAFTDDDRAYATDLNGGGQVVGFSFSGTSVTALGDTAATPVAYPEGVAYAAGKVFAANYGSGGSGTSLTVFEPGDAGNARDVEVPCDGPRGLFVDEEEELVVVCSGRVVYGDPGAEENSNARILFMNPETEAIVDEIALDARLGSINGSQAASYASSAEVMYAISSGSGQLFRIDTDANAVDGPALDVPDTEGYTGLAAVDYDGVRNRVYVARLARGSGGGADYGARGQGVVLDGATGEVVDTFQAGIAPTTVRVLP